MPSAARMGAGVAQISNAANCAPPAKTNTDISVASRGDQTLGGCERAEQEPDRNRCDGRRPYIGKPVRKSSRVREERA